MEAKQNVLAEYGSYVVAFALSIFGVVNCVNFFKNEGFLLTDIVVISLILIGSLWYRRYFSKWAVGKPDEKIFRGLGYVVFSLFMIVNIPTMFGLPSPYSRIVKMLDALTYLIVAVILFSMARMFKRITEKG